MQLWSNGNLSEFAIQFKSEFVVKTSENANFDRVIDEVPYIRGCDFDWRYSLSEWVIFYLSNKYAGLLNSRKANADKEFKLQFDLEDESNVSVHVGDVKSKVPHKPAPKPTLKCHFCNLKYCLDEERNAHEEFWHQNKLLRR
jgi:hypothetical protein